MAKTVGEATEVPQGEAALITSEQFNKVVKRVGTLKANMDEARGELGSVIQTAEEKYNLHRKAFKQIQNAMKMDAAKLADYLRNFDHMRKLAELDKLAGIDMFSGETNVEPIRGRRSKQQHDAEQAQGAQEASA